MQWKIQKIIFCKYLKFNYSNIWYVFDMGKTVVPSLDQREGYTITRMKL